MIEPKEGGGGPPDLFRPEAIEHAARRLEGAVVLASPLSLRLLTSLFAVVVLLGLTFASIATYSKRETVSGWIAPDRGLIRITARQAGILERVLVHEGDQVEAGASIASIRLSTDATGGDSGRAILRGLEDERTANLAQISSGRAKLLIRRREIASRIGLLQDQLSETESRVQILEQRRFLADQEVARGDALMAKGFMSKASMGGLKSAALSAAEGLSTARSIAIDLKRQISEASAELEMLPAELATLEAQAAQLSAANDQKRVSTDSQNWIDVTAPVAGRVAALPVSVGQAVNQGTSLAVVLPAGSDLIAELYIPSKAIGFIRIGQDVRLQYQAFPYQTFGTGKGRVAEISQTVLSPADVAIPGLVFTEPVFRIRVTLERPSIAAYGRQVPLQPGILLKADIVTDRRSLIEWLLDPLYAVGRRS